MANLKQKSKKRIKQNAEVFTPNSLVNDMLNKLPKEVWYKNKTFCDPACGNGNFLVWILLRKIAKGHEPIEALKTVYGADIMRDNIQECRLRLLKVISLYETITEEHIEAIFRNIIWINMHRYPGGSLDYDFSFKNRPKRENVESWMKNIHEKQKLNEVELPVDEEAFTPRGSNDLFAE